MTGMLEHERPGSAITSRPPEDADEIKHGKWDRWAKKRTFVRALEGTYSHLYKKLLEEPRVYSSKDHPWKGGPAMYGKHVISPQRRQHRAVDRVAYRVLRAAQCRAKARPPQQRGVLRAQGPRP